MGSTVFYRHPAIHGKGKDYYYLYNLTYYVLRNYDSNCNRLSSARIPDNDTATLISYKVLQRYNQLFFFYR